MSYLEVQNNLYENAPKTRLTHAEEAGTNVLRWINPNGFGASWAIQVGDTGQEQTEVVLLGTDTPAGTAGTLTANTLYPHPADTPIYGIKYDQVVFEVSTVGTSGTASPITDGTVTYQADSSVTRFDYTSAASTDAYRSYFRNSVGSQTTTESDWQIPAGFNFYSLFKLRERGKNKLWNASWLTDSIIDEWINECKEQMVNKAIQVNEDYALGTAQVSFGTNGLGTVTTEDFSQPKRFWITYNGTDWYRSTKMGINSYLPDQVFPSTHPYHAWMGDSIFQVKPSESPGTAEIVFYRFGTTMVNDTDILPVPMRSYTNIFVDYIKANALSKDEKFTEGNTLMSYVEAKMQDFVQNLAPRDKTGPTMIDIVETISGDDRIIY